MVEQQVEPFPLHAHDIGCISPVFREQHHGVRGDRLTAPRGVLALGCSCFYGHPALGQTHNLGDFAPHSADVRSKPRFLSDDHAVHVNRLQLSLVDPGHGLREQFRARNTFVLFVRVGEVISYAAQSGGTEQRVYDLDGALIGRTLAGGRTVTNIFDEAGRWITESYDEADVVILGVSRTSKTPTSVYLASHYCLKVANCPLVLDLDPPREIFKLKKPHVVGLTISSEELAHVRRNRFKKGSVPNYYDPKSIRAELGWADGIFRRIRGIHVLEVTGRTVEEVSNLIMEGAAEKAIHGSEVIS